MTEPFRTRLSEAIAEVERELNLRRVFYPQRVRSGRMSKIAMRIQLDRMQAARDFLQELRRLKGSEYEGSIEVAQGAVDGERSA